MNIEMASRYEQHSILVIFQDEKDKSELSTICNLKNVALQFTKKTDTVVKKVDKVKPEILIFCLKDLNISQQIMLDLVRNSNYLSFNAKAILLSSTAHVKLANKLCMKGIFDDYVLFWPNYDIERINFSLYYLLSNAKIIGQNNDNSFAIKSLLPDLETTSTNLSKYTEANNASTKDLENTFNSVVQTVTGINFNDQSITEKLNRELQQIQDLLVSMKGGMSQHVTSINNTLNEACSTVRSSVSAIGYKVLLIDDDANFSSMFSMLLERCNFEVITANKITDGMKLLSNQQMDLIFLDYHMPEIDGVKGLSMIRSDERTKKVPIIMLTAASDRGIVEASIKAGASDFIVKPPSKDLILKKIQAHIKGFIPHEHGEN